jgi:hypothetical protein
MPGHNAPPGPSAHHVPHRAIWSIAAAIIVLALAGCTTSATTTNTSATDVATASPAAKGQALVAMLDWLTHGGQAQAAATAYVPLPPQIRQLARTMLQQITDPAGTRLLG